jgi:integrase
VTPATLSSALLDYYEMRKGRYSPNTWKAHEAQLERMRDWIVKDFREPGILLSEIDERMMVKYFNRLRPPFKSASTFSNYRQYSMMFFEFCRKEGWVDRNPMRHVDSVSIPKRIRLQLTAEEMLSMLDSASPRDRIALALGMNTGLRALDIMSLKVGAANLFNNKLAAWIEKTDKEDLLPINSELRAELIRWLQHYAEVNDMTIEQLPNQWTLVPPAHFQGFNVWRPELGGKIVYKTTSRYTHPEKIVHRALEKLGLATKGEGFHTLRRSAARALFDLAGAEGVPDPIRIPQAMLGHQNRQTTEIYLGITHEKQLLDDLLRGKSFLGRVRQNDRDAIADAPVVPQTDQNGGRQDGMNPVRAGGRVKSA